MKTRATIKLTVWVTLQFDKLDLKETIDAAERIKPESILSVKRGSGTELDYWEAFVEGVSRDE